MSKINVINQLKKYSKDEENFFGNIYKNMSEQELSDICIYCDTIDHINDLILKGQDFIIEMNIGNNYYTETNDLNTFFKNIEIDLEQRKSLNVKIKTINNNYVEFPIIFDPKKCFSNKNMYISLITCRFTNQ